MFGVARARAWRVCQVAVGHGAFIHSSQHSTLHAATDCSVNLETPFCIGSKRWGFIYNT